MLGKLTTLIGAISCLAAMSAAILREGPFWFQVWGAVAISTMLVFGAITSLAAKGSADKVNAFLEEVENEGHPKPTLRIVPDDDDKELH